MHVFSINSNQNSQSKKNLNQCFSEERDEWNIKPHLMKTLEFLDPKAEGYQVNRQDLDILLRLNLLYL